MWPTTLHSNIHSSCVLADALAPLHTHFTLATCAPRRRVEQSVFIARQQKALQNAKRVTGQLFEIGLRARVLLFRGWQIKLYTRNQEPPPHIAGRAPWLRAGGGGHCRTFGGLELA